MNNCKTSAEAAITVPAPLFASSWMALFDVLRNSLIKERRESHVSVNVPGGGTDCSGH